MIPKECKRLAEVDFPIAVVSAHSAREKSIRHGHPQRFICGGRGGRSRHAVRCCSRCCCPILATRIAPTTSRRRLGRFGERSGQAGPKDIDLRKALLKFIGDFSNWDLAANPSYLEVGRGLVKAAHGEEAPLVVDPFAGGGSIPLEALRLGCDAFASDLNPVACLILKVMLEDIPRHGPKLAEELRRVGAEIKKQAEKELGQYYPPDTDGATPIAYLWARTVTCESPNCGAEIPLVRSFWLCKKASRLRALKYEVKRPKGKPPYVEFEVFQPKSEKQVPAGTVREVMRLVPLRECASGGPRARPTAPAARRRGCDIRQRRTTDRRRTAARVVTLKDDAAGRQYRVATDRDYEAVRGGTESSCQAREEKLAERDSV